ncbi:MAG TPA: hypothetical protein VGH73_23690 [Thermoanaerobaculia bacterium]|jgi:hypothetical protein
MNRNLVLAGILAGVLLCLASCVREDTKPETPEKPAAPAGQTSQI